MATAARPHPSPTTPQQQGTTIASRLLTAGEVAGKGKALIASQPLRGGQIVLRDSPILIYSALPLLTLPHSQQQEDNNKDREKLYCSNCFRILLGGLPNPPFPCFSCSYALFCSPACRSSSSSLTHSPWLCQTLARLRTSPSPLSSLHPDLHLQARFLVSAYNLAALSPPSFRLLLSLYDGLAEGNPAARAAAANAALLHSLVPPPPVLELELDFSPELAAALLAKDKLNSFSLMEPLTQDGRRSARAYAIYPNASFFNHDCLPNACRYDYVDGAGTVGNTEFTIRMIHDVPQGREICLSYFAVNQRYSRRQTRLREDFGFVCHCDRCKIEANWSDDDDDDDDEDDEDEANGDVMEEDDNDEPVAAAAAAEGPEEDDGFPHAYFFLKFMCTKPNCGGTLAPLPPMDDGSPSNVMECNACGNLKNADDESDNADDTGEHKVSMDI